MLQGWNGQREDSVEFKDNMTEEKDLSIFLGIFECLEKA